MKFFDSWKTGLIANTLIFINSSAFFGYVLSIHIIQTTKTQNVIRTVLSINRHGTSIVSSITFTVFTNFSIKLTILSRENSVSSFVAMRRNEFLKKEKRMENGKLKIVFVQISCFILLSFVSIFIQFQS